MGSPIARAAVSKSLDTASILGLAGLRSAATRTAPGTSARRYSRRLDAVSAAKKLTPVMLPPGRARLATRPTFTGGARMENDRDHRGSRFGRQCTSISGGD